MRSCVPDEPPIDAGEKLCTFRIRFPDGQQQLRRFLATHTLQVHIVDLYALILAYTHMQTDTHTERHT